MDFELREKIIKQAKLQGLTHEAQKHGDFTVDSYAGNVIVNVEGNTYKVEGRKARHHTASFTNGYCSIQRKTACTGLR